MNMRGDTNFKGSDPSGLSVYFYSVIVLTTLTRIRLTVYDEALAYTENRLLIQQLRMVLFGSAIRASPSCHFFCSEDEGYLFEKAIELWKSTIQPQKKEKGGIANAKMYTFLEQNIRVFLWLHKLAHRLTFVIIYFLKIFLSLVFHGFDTEA